MASQNYADYTVNSGGVAISNEYNIYGEWAKEATFPDLRRLAIGTSFVEVCRITPAPLTSFFFVTASVNTIINSSAIKEQLFLTGTISYDQPTNTVIFNKTMDDGHHPNINYQTTGNYFQILVKQSNTNTKDIARNVKIVSNALYPPVLT